MTKASPKKEARRRVNKEVSLWLSLAVGLSIAGLFIQEHVEKGSEPNNLLLLLWIVPSGALGANLAGRIIADFFGNPGQYGWAEAGFGLVSFLLIALFICGTLMVPVFLSVMVPYSAGMLFIASPWPSLIALVVGALIQVRALIARRKDAPSAYRDRGGDAALSDDMGAKP